MGIEDVLHIEFDYDRSKYHVADVVRGWIYFVLVSDFPMGEILSIFDDDSECICAMSYGLHFLFCRWGPNDGG